MEKAKMLHRSSRRFSIGVPVLRAQGAGGLGGLGIRVLDVLGLVQNDGLPGMLGDFRAQRPQLRVVHHEQVGLGPGSFQHGGLFPAPKPHPQPGAEPFRLGAPIVHNRFRADH